MALCCCRPYHVGSSNILTNNVRGQVKGSGEEDTPRAGTLLTLALALVAVYFGNLNLIAPVLSMFFLTTYGVLNASAAIETFLRSPSFRPTFREIGSAACT